jgi:lincosamide nucleotidyltransferase A/C/D/E
VGPGDVLTVLDALAQAGVAAWLDGGWGVDALLGHQTRVHEDMDLVIELSRVDDAAAALEGLGFQVVENYLPIRAVMRARDRNQVDLHLVTFDEHGTGWRANAAPDGSDCLYPAGGFGHGEVAGRSGPCLEAWVQLDHHRGYEPRERDRLDVAALASTFDLTPPSRYRSKPTRNVP